MSLDDMPALRSRLPARPGPWRFGSLVLASVLGACGSAPPLPPPPRPATSSPAPQPAAPPPEVSAPEPVPVAIPPSPPPAPQLPYGEAVAARFPAPSVHYDTPGLADGRGDFTTQAELQSFMQSLAAVPATRQTPTVQKLTLGISQQGVPIEALGITRYIDAQPATWQRGDRPTVLFIGQQHGDEPAGCEALIALSRQLAGGPLTPLLDRVNVIIVPRANPDGALAQTRAGANGLDINRDHLLLQTPEAQALARVTRDYRPLVVVDAHEYTVVGPYLQKFDAIQRFDALLQYAMTANLPAFVTRASEEWFRQPLIDALQAAQLSSEWYYTTSRDSADKIVSMGGVQPDNGRNVDGLGNAVSLLIETRGVGLGHFDAQRRVHAQVTAMTSVLRSAAARGGDLMKLRQYVDAEISAQACQGDAVVEAAPTRGQYRLLMLDPQTGADKPVLVAWDSALQLVATKTRARPCGYWLSADSGDAVARLRTLGLQVQQFNADASVPGNSYHELSRSSGPRQDVRGAMENARDVTRVQVELVDALIDMPAGSFYVPLTQPLANLAIAALEPDTQNSFVANGIIAATDRVARLRVVPESSKRMPLP